jgi:hypothetical protein
LKFTQHLYLNGILNDNAGMSDIPKRVIWIRWEIGGEINKIKNAQKTVHDLKRSG